MVPYSGAFPTYAFDSLSGPARVYFDFNADAGFVGVLSSAVAGHPSLTKWTVARRGNQVRLVLTFKAPTNVVVLNDAGRHQVVLVPQGAGRRFLLGELQLADGPDADFPLIGAGAFNPVGRIRVAEAVDYFRTHVARHPAARGLPGLTLDDVVQLRLGRDLGIYKHDKNGDPSSARRLDAVSRGKADCLAVYETDETVRVLPWCRVEEPPAGETAAPRLVVDVAYDHMQSGRFRHTAQFRRWRKDKKPKDCTFDQLEAVPPQELQAIFGAGK